MIEPVHLALDTAMAARTILTNAVAAAVMAPSSHNTQPWRFRIVDRTAPPFGSADGRAQVATVAPVLEIYADPSRHLHVIDGDRRQQIQSCGCALYNARVAVRAMGFTDEVTAMVTDADHPNLVATLHLGPKLISSDDELAEMRAIPLRHTNRRAFLKRPIALETSNELIDAAVREGAWMVRLEPELKHRLGVLIDQADQLQFDNPAFRDELSKWLIPFGSRRRDGIPFVEKEYGSSMPFAVMRALRTQGLGTAFGKIEEELVDHSPVVAVIGTYSDEPTEWLACGQALQAMLLHATRLGMSASFLNQVLEVPEQRGRVAELLGGVGFPHMVVRVGYSESPIHHAAPRRALDDVLEVV